MTTSATVPPIETVAPGLRSRVDPGTFAGTQKLLFGVGAIFLIVSLVIGLTGDEHAHEQFYFSYLVSFMFGLSLVLGGMFFVLVQHLSRAGWSVVVRRVAENFMSAAPLMALLFIPVIMGFGTLYHHWVHTVGLTEGEAGYDAVIAGKSGYLNSTFFFIRAFLYFAIWIGIAVWFRRMSLKQDQNGDTSLTLKMARVGAPCMFLFALSLTFAAIDWMMSLDPHWFSTIFGVYYFAGSFMAFNALLALTMMWLQRKGQLTDAVTTEHYHDVGKLMFAFVVFWTYIAVSQYLLIWYANLPEETMWYKHHLEGSWATIGNFQIFGHFIIPFAFLMSRHIKRARATLAVAAVFLLFIHWVDLYWIIMPTFHTEGVSLHFQDFTTLIAVVALFLGWFIGALRKAPLIPERDPRLSESLRFVNH